MRPQPRRGLCQARDEWALPDNAYSPAQRPRGIYRLTSTVLEPAGSTTGFATYSLPLPAVL